MTVEPYSILFNGYTWHRCRITDDDGQMHDLKSPTELTEQEWISLIPPPMESLNPEEMVFEVEIDLVEISAGEVII